MHKDDMTLLEALVDKYDMQTVCDGLVQINHLKAEHVAHTWQDAPLAKLYERNASKLQSVVLENGWR